MEDRYTITATDIGKIIGKTARQVNKLLESRNVIKKNVVSYVFTQRGQEYGESYNFNSGGSKITNLKYNDKVFNILFSTTVLEPDEPDKPDIEFWTADDIAKGGDDLPF